MRRTLPVWMLNGLALLAGGAPPLAAALTDPPHVDIRFLGEHLPEAAQDARAYALPWPESAPPAGRWRPFAAAGASSARTEFLEEKGWLASAGVTRGFAGERALVLFGFYDAFSVGGGSGEQVLPADFLAAAPLDLPERAWFSNPRGDFRHYGVGAAWSWRVSSAAARRPWRAEAGLMIDRLTLDGYELDYELLGGADAGTRGVLDQSSAATFATPFVGIGCRIPLGARFALVPRALGGAPLPEGDFDGRLTGPGFDLSSQDPGGDPGRIGDGFVAVSVGLLHAPSGLELDLGGALFYPIFEQATHDGVDRAALIHLTWHGR
jgi:hypothetical protein